MKSADREALALTLALADLSQAEQRQQAVEDLRRALGEAEASERSALEAACALLQGPPAEDDLARVQELLSALLQEPAVDSQGMAPSEAPVQARGAQAAIIDFLQRNRTVGEELLSLAARWLSGDAQSSAELRRRLHTLKGDAGILGLDALQALCHLAESDSTSDQGKEIRRWQEHAQAISETLLALHQQHAVAPTMRVEVERVALVADLIGELVIAQGMLSEKLGRLERSAQTQLARVDRLLRAAQQAAGRLRLVPVRGIFARAESAAIDAAARSGRQVLVTIQGANTELDQAVVEQLGDPLLHLVRNAVAHGLETPEDRRAHGKPAQGTIALSAFMEDGHVIICVADNGRGLSRSRILDRAARLGWELPSDDAPDEQVWALLFRGGLSTAEQLDTLSGRGIGLDVVKTVVEQLRGTLTVESQPSQGTTFVLAMPQTQALVDGMRVQASGQRFVVPTLCLHGCVRPLESDLCTVAQGQRMLWHHGSWIPWFALSQLLHLPGSASHRLLGIVVHSHGRSVALGVDSILGRGQSVLKPVPGLPRLEGVIGAAIAHDGQVDLVIDPSGLLRDCTLPTYQESPVAKEFA